MVDQSTNECGLSHNRGTEVYVTKKVTHKPGEIICHRKDSPFKITVCDKLVCAGGEISTDDYQLKR
jgi:hypothetical protein